MFYILSRSRLLWRFEALKKKKKKTLATRGRQLFEELRPLSPFVGINWWNPVCVLKWYPGQTSQVDREGGMSGAQPWCRPHRTALPITHGSLFHSHRCLSKQLSILLSPWQLILKQTNKTSWSFCLGVNFVEIKLDKLLEPILCKNIEFQRFQVLSRRA